MPVARTTIATPPVCRATTRPESDCLGAGEAEIGRADCVEALAVVAHELRGPLAAILYAIEATAGPGDADPAARRSRAIVERQTRRAARIVDDLFDVCAGSWDKLSLRTEVVDVAGVVAGAVQTADRLVTEGGHRLTVSLPSEPLCVVADPLRLEQVLTNLLTNAAKFTDAGGHIRLAAEANAGQVVFRVRDDGRGIAPHLLARVFDPFTRGVDPGSRGSGGLGIGLALVKSLVELHGGRVAASSDGAGRGTEFVVRLPAHGGAG